MMLKRTFDVVVSSIGLALALPFMCVIAVAIKADDGGPVFYRQPRVGRGGRKFQVWKVRSMIPNADRLFGPLQARAADTRITRVGRVLRATAMDELPQLWSILCGDMSFVGPRALMPAEIETDGNGRPLALADIPGYEARHAIQPGLTGIAQVYARRDIDRRHKFRYDLLYIRKRSFALDVRLMMLSLWITVRAGWEHRGRKA